MAILAMKSHEQNARAASNFAADYRVIHVFLSP
jgi:hypothetical protein